MKIFAIGLNYDSHNKEMKRTFESEEPVLFMKPDTALLKDGKPFIEVKSGHIDIDEIKVNKPVNTGK